MSLRRDFARNLALVFMAHGTPRPLLFPKNFKYFGLKVLDDPEGYALTRN